MTQINLKNITLLLLLPAFTMVLVGCGGGGIGSQDIPLTTPVLTSTSAVGEVHDPTPMVENQELLVPDSGGKESLSPDMEIQTSSKQMEATLDSEELFWNAPMAPAPKCAETFEFTHKLTDPKDIAQIYFGTGSHIAPHEHMAYWGVMHVDGEGQELFNPDSEATPVSEAIVEDQLQISERIQLFAPVDIYYIDLRKEARTTIQGDVYVEWGGYFYTCDGHQLMFGHIGEPSDQIKAVLSRQKEECDVNTSGNDQRGCIWQMEAFIPSGTPLFMNSGYTGAFDFGLSLSGLTAKELQAEPGYGYSVTPWRSPSGKSVCPIEYFPEPTKSAYLELLRGAMCGPFNQDVPGTAMGYWLPSPSPETVPLMAHWKGDDEWETIWLFDFFNERSEQGLTVGNNTFGLDYNEAHYYFKVVEGGLVNQPWDLVKPGHNYCTELKQGSNTFERNEKVHRIIITALSEDGTKLTIEALDDDTCGNGPWAFQGMERTFYR